MDNERKARAEQDGPRKRTIMTCAFCNEPILPEEHKPLEAWTQRDMHNECLVRAVAGSAAHQLGECSCFGGSREDPPGMTIRQAALLAYETFTMLRAARDSFTVPKIVEDYGE
jgi:hypothetical protein